MPKTGLMKYCVGLAIASIVACTCSATPPPNFIFFIADDVSPEDLGCYGGPVPTPNLDRLAATGMRFLNAYVTASSCSPSRCSIITSRYPHNTGAPELHMPLPHDQWKFPGRLRRAGYYSVLNGKNHMEYDGVTEKNAWLADAFDKIMKGKKPGGEEEWIEVLRQRPENKPFFFWFASHDAHRDWQFNENAPQFKPEEVVAPPYLFDGPETRKDLAGYYHEVARADFHLGQLMDEVEREGLADRTYIIFCSDNGKPFPRCKTRLLDTGMKTPLLIAGPGIEGKSVSSSLVSMIDIGPTILDLAKVPIPEQFQGVSLIPVLKDPSASVRDYIFGEHNWHIYPANERMVRYKNWVYIRNYRFKEQNLCGESSDQFPAGKELWDAEAKGVLRPEQRDVFLKPRPYEELYDVEKDPLQFNNMARSPELAPVLNELRKVMDAWREETGDTVPENPTLCIGGITPEKRGEMPGQSTDASHILKPGPIRK